MYVNAKQSQQIAGVDVEHRVDDTRLWTASRKSDHTSRWPPTTTAGRHLASDLSTVSGPMLHDD